MCEKCHEQIEWKKKMAKYKPLTQPAKCLACSNKTVKAAYHTICTPCATKLGQCAKCRQPYDPTANKRVSAKQVLEEGVLPLSSFLEVLIC